MKKRNFFKWLITLETKFIGKYCMWIQKNKTKQRDLFTAQYPSTEELF